MWCDTPAVKTEPPLDRWQHCVLNKARDSRHRGSLTEIPTSVFVISLQCARTMSLTKAPHGSGLDAAMTTANKKLEKMQQYMSVGMQNCAVVAQDVIEAYKGASDVGGGADPREGPAQKSVSHREERGGCLKAVPPRGGFRDHGCRRAVCVCVWGGHVLMSRASVPEVPHRLNDDRRILRQIYEILRPHLAIFLDDKVVV